MILIDTGAFVARHHGGDQYHEAAVRGWAELGWFDTFSDQRVSFTDCVSFTLMKEHGIDCAFTFDDHFLFAGFRVWP